MILQLILMGKNSNKGRSELNPQRPLTFTQKVLKGDVEAKEYYNFSLKTSIQLFYLFLGPPLSK